MKQFLKMTLAVIVGLLIVTIISTAFMFAIIGAMASSGKPVAQVTGGSVLKIDLSSVVLAEQSLEANPFQNIQGGPETRTIGIWDAVQAVEAAAENPAIKCIYLKTDGSMCGLASLQEFRKALSFFRVSGKPVIAYIEAPTTGSYYLASVADKVYMTSHPGASPMITGVGTQMIFLKDILDKLGVNVQLIRHGKYKSAGEMFVRNSPSGENLEQYQEMINSIWSTMAAEISESRGISVEDLNTCIDGLKLVLPSDFLDNRLVDELMTREELKEKLATLAVKDNFKDVNIVNFPDYVDLLGAVPSKARKKIAVIYADGDIIDGKVKQNVAGDRFASIISQVRADSTVKAVVLRVNSPGGSVLASDKIRAELNLLKQDKPLIASYGDYAASGGYWISSNCDKIYSDAATLTGSIGVFSMIPDLSRTAREIAHINVTSVVSNKHGDMYSFMRPLDNAEYDYMLHSVEDIYDRFTSIVAEGRDLDADYVDSIGQGRVWTGADALGKGLVDEIGTLEDAVRYAAACAGDATLANWKVTGFPAPLTNLEMVMEMLGESKDAEDNIFAGTFLEKTASALKGWAKNAGNGKADIVFARIPFGIDIR